MAAQMAEYVTLAVLARATATRAPTPRSSATAAGRRGRGVRRAAFRRRHARPRACSGRRWRRRSRPSAFRSHGWSRAPRAVPGVDLSRRAPRSCRRSSRARGCWSACCRRRRRRAGLLDRAALALLPRGAHVVNVGARRPRRRRRSPRAARRRPPRRRDARRVPRRAAAPDASVLASSADRRDAARLRRSRWSTPRWRRSPPRSAGSSAARRCPASSIASAATERRDRPAMTAPASRRASASSRSGPRDGLQNEKAIVPTDVKVALIDRLTDAGLPGDRGDVLRLAEVGAADGRRGRRDGAHPPQARRPLSGADAEPEGLRGGARGAAPTRSRCSSPRRRRSRRRTSTARSPRASSARSRCSPRRAAHGMRVRGYISCVLGCPYEGEVDPARGRATSRRTLHGDGRPTRSRSATRSASARRPDAGADRARSPSACPVAALAGHFHDTYGQALANVYAALRDGRGDVRLLGRGARRLSVRQGRDRQRRERGRRLPAARPRHRDRRRHDEAARRRPLHLATSSAAPPVSRVARALDARRSRCRRRMSARARRRPRAAARRRDVASPCISRVRDGRGDGPLRRLLPHARRDRRVERARRDDEARRSSRRCRRAARASPAPRAASDDRADRRLVLRLRLAVRVPAERAAGDARRRGCRVRYRPVLFAGAARRARAEGSGRDPGQARVHLSLRRLAGEDARHPAQVPARASVQPAAAAAPRDRLRLRAATRCTGSSASSGATGACPTCRSNGPSSRDDLGAAGRRRAHRARRR